MLSDFERKLLRIVFNFSSQRHRMPSMMELERVTGKPAATILQGMDGLVKQEYILWPNRPHLDTIVILEAWEREGAVIPKPRQSRSTEYWTQY